jgi:hypothetical protein
MFLFHLYEVLFVRNRRKDKEDFRNARYKKQYSPLPPRPPKGGGLERYKKQYSALPPAKGRQPANKG